MSPRNRLNLSLLLLLLLLLLAVWLTDTAPPPTAALPHLTGPAASAIDTITLSRRGEAAIALQRRAGVWYLTAPFQIRANPLHASSIAAFASAETLRQLPFTAADAAQYGVEDPTLRVTFNGDQQQQLQVGDRSPLDQRYYLRQADTLHLMDERSWQRLNRRAIDLVDSALLPPNATITRLALPDLILQQEPERGAWQQLSADATSAPQPLNADRANTLIDEWRYARAITLNPHAEATRGEPITITFTTPANGSETITWQLIERSPDLVLLHPDQPIRYHLPESAATRLLQLPPIEGA